MGKTKAKLRMQKALAKRWSPYRSTSTGTSTTSDDSGVFSLPSTSPGQSPSQDVLPGPSDAPGITAAEPPTSEQGGCQTPGPEQSVNEMTCSEAMPGSEDSPASDPIQCHTTGPEQVVCEMIDSPASLASEQVQCQTPGPEQVVCETLSLEDSPASPSPEHVVSGHSTRVFDPESLRQKVLDACPDLSCDRLFVSSCEVALEATGIPQIYFSSRSWNKNYPVLSFLMNGQLYAEYQRVTGMLGLQPCSEMHWGSTVKWLEGYVTTLAEASCKAVRVAIWQRGDHQKWTASYDGFYLTKGHYSNNSSATLHDYATGKIAWFAHRTKKGKEHNWEGTSAGAEGDMLDEVLKNAKDEGFNVKEIVTDKDSSVKSIYLHHFPEGIVTYCSNHCSKTFHKDLQKIKQEKCQCRALGSGQRCKRMGETFLTSCKKHLQNLISSTIVSESEDRFTRFSSSLLNFYNHYCLDDHSSQWCIHDKERDGKPYKSKNWFTCLAQTEPFKKLLSDMASKPQDYVSSRGRTTTNAVEGFHGLALLYRDKRTDLGHFHYTCKTNMSICHKNLGPIWKVICCSDMGVEMPVAAVEKILEEQRDWEKCRKKRTGEDFHRKRNKQKAAKNMRHEAEKQHMTQRQEVGIAIGQYQGRGQGESEATEPQEVDAELIESVTMDVDCTSENDSEDDIETEPPSNELPLLFFFDVETTGLVVYNDFIIDIAAKVIDVPPSAVSHPTYQSLVRTSKTIPNKVVKLTRITNTDLLGERPLSIVMVEFLTWISTTTREYAEFTGNHYFPVLVAHNGFRFDFPILLAEMDRRKEHFDTASLIHEHHLHFADTLIALRKAKKEGNEALKTVTKFNVTDLFKTFLPGHEFAAHRALPDVEAVESLFMLASLYPILATLGIRTPQQQLHSWMVQKKKRQETQQLLRHFGKKITKAHASQLNKRGITHTILAQWKAEAKDVKAFAKTLKKHQVKSKKLQDNLCLFYFQQNLPA